MGGSIFGNIDLTGSIDEISASGGNIDATIGARGSVGQVYAAIDSIRSLEAISPVILSSISWIDLTSIGGAITASLATLDPGHVALEVDAVTYQGTAD